MRDALGLHVRCALVLHWSIQQSDDAPARALAVCSRSALVYPAECDAPARQRCALALQWSIQRSDDAPARSRVPEMRIGVSSAPALPIAGSGVLSLCTGLASRAMMRPHVLLRARDAHWCIQRSGTIHWPRPCEKCALEYPARWHGPVCTTCG